MDDIAGFLLGNLKLFYPLLIASVILFIYALIKRSWVGMLFSGILLLPDAWFFSGYPLYPWAKFVPLLHAVLAIILSFLKRTKPKY